MTPFPVCTSPRETRSAGPVELDTSTLAAPYCRPFGLIGGSQESRVGVWAHRQGFSRTESLICGLFEDFLQRCKEHPKDLHPRSSTSRVTTNGDSFIRASLLPLSIPSH